jgi:RHS repeat-associated protein
LVLTDGEPPVQYYYDHNGNLEKTNRGALLRTYYTWDTSNRLVEVKDGQPVVLTATYDSRSRRLTKTEGGTTTVFRYDGGVCLQELQDDTITARFVRGADMGGGIGGILYGTRPASGQQITEFFVYNQVGHTVAQTAQSKVARTVWYEGFGDTIDEYKLTWDTQNNRLANTKELDSSTGLYYHGFRYYDPTIGRYISADPIGYEGGPNLYAYVGNNPVTRIDPTGLNPWDVYRALTIVRDTERVANMISGRTDVTIISKAANQVDTALGGAADYSAETIKGTVEAMARQAVTGARLAYEELRSGNYNPYIIQAKIAAHVARDAAGGFVEGYKSLAEEGASFGAAVSLGDAEGMGRGLAVLVHRAVIPALAPGAARYVNSKFRLMKPAASKGGGRRLLPLKDQSRVREINRTLDRIDDGGPFPYKKDGSVFHNREGRLPQGNYREYTVETPGASNRGTCRIVRDQDTGRTYYTDDHYKNFTQIDPKKY